MGPAAVIGFFIRHDTFSAIAIAGGTYPAGENDGREGAEPGINAQRHLRMHWRPLSKVLAGPHD